MCLWLLTACLGLLPSNPSQNTIVVVGYPTAIVQPTTAATTLTTRPAMFTPSGNITTRPPLTNMTNSPPNTPPPTTAMPTTRPPMLTPPAMTNPPLPPQPTTNAPGGIYLPVVICNNPQIVCIANPNQIVAGSPAIDPRLGTTPSPLMWNQLPPISAYSGQAVSFDDAVKFPRQKRSLDGQIKARVIEVLNKTRDEILNHNITKRQANCMCVPAGTCPTMNGNGLIDFRIVTPMASQCPAGQVYCCTTPGGGGGGGGAPLIACGTRQTVPAIMAAAGQAEYGKYPWMAIILTKQNDFIAGGVLIDQFNVLTVIHRLQPYIVSGTAPNVKIRLGEWNAAGTNEPIPFKEFTVLKVFQHPSFNAGTLQYDIAVVRLSTPVPITPMASATTTINRACLPPSATTSYNGQRCWVTGWGKNAFGIQGQYQQILKEVDVPIVPSPACEAQLRTARLGAAYVFDTTSFICAGGEANKDSCTGDGGSGLVCQVNGQWVVVGLVAWGLGCASANVPGVYVNVAALLPWIQQQVAAT